MHDGKKTKESASTRTYVRTYLHGFEEADDVGVAQVLHDLGLAVQVVARVVLFDLLRVDHLDGKLQQHNSTTSLNIRNKHEVHLGYQQSCKRRVDVVRVGQEKLGYWSVAI